MADVKNRYLGLYLYASIDNDFDTSQVDQRWRRQNSLVKEAWSSREKPK